MAVRPRILKGRPMSHDRETRRTVAVLVCVAVMTASPGCRRSPFQRLADDSPAGPSGSRPRQRSLDLPAAHPRRCSAVPGGRPGVRTWREHRDDRRGTPP